jgi:predicted HTH transcriptional regulator
VELLIKTGGIVGSLFGLLPLSLGIWLTVRIVKHLQEKKTQRNRKNIIATTIEHGGRITPIELTLKLDISLEEAQEELDLLTQKDIFELEISEDGVLFYYLKKNLSRGSNK